MGGGGDGLHRFLARDRPHNRDDAEHLPGGGQGGGHVALLLLRLYVDGALADIDLEAAQRLQSPPHIGHQLILKGPAVQSFQDDLAQFQKQHFIVVHIVPPLKTFKIHLIG